MKVFSTRTDILHYLPKNLIIAELGVFEGTFSKKIYNICSPSKLYLVDVFEGVHRSGDKDGINFKVVYLDEAYQNLKENFKNKNVDVVKSNTEKFLTSLENNSLDVVYIDADHSYNSVLQDLTLSRQKVKIGGFLCGHDYVDNSDVQRAVDDFCKLHNLEIDIIAKDGCPSFCINNL